VVWLVVIAVIAVIVYLYQLSNKNAAIANHNKKVAESGIRFTNALTIILTENFGTEKSVDKLLDLVRRLPEVDRNNLLAQIYENMQIPQTSDAGVNYEILRRQLVTTFQNIQSSTSKLITPADAPIVESWKDFNNRIG
jgi:hypothetical protein